MLALENKIMVSKLLVLIGIASLLYCIWMQFASTSQEVAILWFFGILFSILIVLMSAGYWDIYQTMLSGSSSSSQTFDDMEITAEMEMEEESMEIPSVSDWEFILLLNFPRGCRQILEHCKISSNHEISIEEMSNYVMYPLQAVARINQILKENYSNYVFKETNQNYSHYKVQMKAI